MEIVNVMDLSLLLAIVIAVVFEDSLYLFGGYDGSYRCDFHRFDFETHTWRVVETSGKVPRSRYRGTCVVHDDRMILQCGHDGNKHLQDTHIYNSPLVFGQKYLVPTPQAPVIATLV